MSNGLQTKALFYHTRSELPLSGNYENNTIDSGELDIGRRAIQEVPPGIFWRSQLFIDQPQFLKFNISLQKDALIGVYGRKGLPPSHTQVSVGVAFNKVRAPTSHFQTLLYL